MRNYIKLVEESQKYLYFLRDTRNPRKDLERGFSCEVNSWFKTEQEAKQHAIRNSIGGKYLQDPHTKLWCGSPEIGLSSFAFWDKSSFKKAKENIKRYTTSDTVAIYSI